MLEHGYGPVADDGPLTQRCRWRFEVSGSVSVGAVNEATCAA